MPPSLSKTKNRSSRNEEELIMPQNFSEDHTKQKKKIFAELKHAFTRNWLIWDILFQVIWGGAKLRIYIGTKCLKFC